MILAIDPGTTQSAVCVIEQSASGVKFGSKILPNYELLESIKDYRNYGLAIEMVACYGMPVGREVFETVLWTGRFIQAHGGGHRLVYRSEVKIHLCRSMKANDASINRALRDRFGEKGTKKNPGRLFGFKEDMWSALAIGLTALETPLPEKKT